MRLIPFRLATILGLLVVAFLYGAQWQPLAAAPRAQNTTTATGSATAIDSSGAQHIYLLPAEQTAVGVQVHIAELWLSSAGGENFIDVDATYRLQNPERTAAQPLIRVGTAAGTIGVTQLDHISNLSVTLGDTTIGLQETDNGNYTFRAQTPADGQTTLRLRYRVSLGNTPLATVRYALEPLNRWPDEISIRVEVKAPDAIATDSWTRIEPNGWSYGLATDPGRIDVKWLYNRRAPDAPIIFQFVNPSLWQQVRALEFTPAQARTFDQYTRLGDLYRSLYDAAGHTPVLRDRFLSQTVAAYTAAHSKPGGDDTARGVIHYQMAQLYRAHAPFAAEEQVNHYAQLVVEEVAAALELLPGNDTRRAEMGRWRADGLTLLLQQARQEEEWDRALALVDELDTLPEGSISPTFIEQERDRLLVQKALQLLEEGERDAAFAVAGPHLSGAQLEPPTQMQSLFTRWAFTVTATPEEVHILALAQTAPERHATALNAAQDMVEAFTAGTTRRSSQVSAQATTSQWNGLPALEIDLRAGTNTAFLASLTPAGMDWLLLRTLLDQLSIQVSEQNGLFRRTITLSQPLDLRPAATQWTSMAGTLERQAEEFDNAARATSEGEEALTNRIRAVHYRTVAERWRNLTRQSRLYFEFRVGDPSAENPGADIGASTPAEPIAIETAGIHNAEVNNTEVNNAEVNTGTQPASTSNRLGTGPVTRAWYMSVSGPSQVFTMQAQVLNLARLIMLTILGFSVILALSGLLWWML